MRNGWDFAILLVSAILAFCLYFIFILGKKELFIKIFGISPDDTIESIQGFRWMSEASPILGAQISKAVTTKIKDLSLDLAAAQSRNCAEEVKRARILLDLAIHTARWFGHEVE